MYTFPSLRRSGLEFAIADDGTSEWVRAEDVERFKTEGKTLLGTEAKANVGETSAHETARSLALALTKAEAETKAAVAEAKAEAKAAVARAEAAEAVASNEKSNYGYGGTKLAVIERIVLQLGRMRKRGPGVAGRSQSTKPSAETAGPLHNATI